MYVKNTILNFADFFTKFIKIGTAVGNPDFLELAALPTR
jgi:hypothetical protein